MRFDKVIRNGMVVDGTRSPRFKADIGIKDGVIAEIGFIGEAEGLESIDAEGLIVAPGFIDLHTHYDSQVFWDPYCTLSGWHGVTSAVIGNCGFGFAPVKPDMRERTMLSMTRIEAIPLKSMQQGMPWDWVTYPEFLDSLDRTPKAVNLLPYVPVGPLLVWVLGLEDAKAGRLPTPEEHAELCRLFEEALDAGGCGWSAQRMRPDSGLAVQNDFDGTPMVTDVMNDETCIEFAKILAKRNEGVMQMLLFMKDDDKRRKFFEKLVEVSRRPIIMNVLGADDRNPSKHREELAWLRSCWERGLHVIPQGNTVEIAFTMTFEDWNLWDDSEAWKEATTGTLAERKAKMADPGRRAALRDAKVALTDIKDVVLVGPQLEKNKPFLDHTIGQIAEMTGKHPVDALLDIAVEEDLKTEYYIAAHNNDMTYLKELVVDPWVILGTSDGGAHTRFLTTGRYPTEAITEFVRKHKLLTLEEVHWRLSTFPASVAGFKDRGTLVEGAPADIVIYDYDRLTVLPTEILHDQPGDEWRRVQKASGYRYVLVNGEITIKDDQETKTYSGRLLRGGTAAPISPQAMAAE